MKLPPNPKYEMLWQCSTDDGHARLSIPAPGGSIRPTDVIDLIEWLELIIRRLRRYSAEHEATEATENNREEESDGLAKLGG